MTNGYHPEKGSEKSAAKPRKTTKKGDEAKKPPAKAKGKPAP